MSRIFGVCWQPRIWHGWLPPNPVLGSWQALQRLGIGQVRLTYTPDAPELEQAFAIDYANIIAAGLTVNINAGSRWEIGGKRLKPDPAMVGVWVTRMAHEYPAHLYTFDNEPGALAQAYEEQHPGFDFMFDAYRPALLAFVRSVQSVYPHANFGGCDADSVDIQARAVALWETFLPDIPNFRRRVHPYGDMGGGRYATMAGDDENEGFATQADARPLDIGEIDHQQRAGATGIARDSDLQALLGFARTIEAQYPFVGQIDFGTAEYFFDRAPAPPGIVPRTSWSTWTYGPEPVVSGIGHQFASHFAKVNGTKIGRGPGTGRGRKS